MKPEVKVEGKTVIFKAEQSVAYDSDKDGVAAAEASVSVNFKLDGLELADELLKSSELAQKIKEKLAALGI